ncbi:MAG: hypothetical protein XD91_1826 [Clostridiales bacterium 38_11]|nr:MAG: hypothetical protein XD91_1826 [Clostridiales bacterium 38_11]
MSQKEHNRRKVASFVLKRAWRLFKKQGAKYMYTFSACLKLAWRIVRGYAQLSFSKVRGVSFKNSDSTSRQSIINSLLKYSLEEICLYFEREPDNPFDPNAIKVMAMVAGKGSAQLGYVAKELAENLAVEMDSDREVVVILEEITGISSKMRGVNYSFSLV